MSKLYDWVGSGVATAIDGNKRVRVVSIVFPIPDCPFPEDPENDANFEDRFMTVAAAKSLIIDLQDAVESITSGTEFET